MDSIDRYNVDITGLENLFKDVVIFVEYRAHNEDISLTIGNELKDLGATISENRTKKVTHILFNEGTLRTSDWAKKHNIPLISIGWITTCVNHRFLLVPTPWLIPYMETPVDRFGFKKKVSYKRYIKLMSPEQFKEKSRLKDVRKWKKFEKTLNASKNKPIDESRARSERLIKMSEAVYEPPTPEYVKKLQKRFERRERTGRRSWECSDDEDDIKDESLSLDISDNNNNNTDNSTVTDSDVDQYKSIMDLDYESEQMSDSNNKNPISSEISSTNGEVSVDNGDKLRSNKTFSTDFTEINKEKDINEKTELVRKRKSKKVDNKKEEYKLRMALPKCVRDANGLNSPVAASKIGLKRSLGTFLEGNPIDNEDSDRAPKKQKTDDSKISSDKNVLDLSLDDCVFTRKSSKLKSLDNKMQEIKETNDLLESYGISDDNVDSENEAVKIIKDNILNISKTREKLNNEKKLQKSIKKPRRRKTTSGIEKTPSISTVETNSDCSLFRSPIQSPKKNHYSVNKPKEKDPITLSPLITNIPTDPTSFVTPKKRQSLRTKVLSKSAKKEMTKYSLINFTSSNDNMFVTPENSKNSTRILVPETQKHKMDSYYIFNPLTTSTPLANQTIPETPDCSLLSNTSSNDSNQITDSMIRLLESPGLTRYLKDEFPDIDPKSFAVDENVVMPKRTYYDFGFYSFPPDFTPFRNYLFRELNTRTLDQMKEHHRSIINERRHQNLLKKKKLIKDLKNNEAFNTPTNTADSIFKPDKVSMYKSLNEEDVQPKLSNNNIRKSVLLTKKKSKPPKSFQQHELNNEHIKSNSTPKTNDILSSIEIVDITPEDKIHQTKTSLKSTRKSVRLAKENSISPNSTSTLNSNKSKPLTKTVNNPSNKDGTNDIFVDQSPSKESIIGAKPLISNSNVSIKRRWSFIEEKDKQRSNVRKAPKRDLKHNHRDSRDDFICTPEINSKKTEIKTPKPLKEIIFVGFTEEEKLEWHHKCKSLTNKYRFGELVRSQEQLIVLPKIIGKSLELSKALVMGNTLISIDWIQQVIKKKTWCSFNKFIIKGSELANIPRLNKNSNTCTLFKDHLPIFISSSITSIPKYKLRILIEDAGGVITDSFRMAGIVIGARKFNALSVTEKWILDAIQNNEVPDPNNYQII